MSEMSELNDFLGRGGSVLGVDEQRAPALRQQLGTVVGGSLSQGLVVRLDPGDVPGGLIEDLAVGRYVVIEGMSGRKFFSLISDIVLDSSSPFLDKTPIDTDDDFLMDVYRSTTTFGKISVSPMLVLDHDSDTPRPVKTIPAHFARVYEATEEDVNKVFGAEDDDHLNVGNPLDMENVKVNLNLDRFVERSSGVFGKSGTGKSFITRIMLSGVIQRRKASCLIFDMHNDYGWAVTNEEHTEFKGLRQLFPGRVAVYSLDPETSRQRGSKTEADLYIQYDQIEPEDVEMLAKVLGLSDVQVGALYYLRRRLGKAWVNTLLNAEGEGDAQTRLDELLEEGNLIKGTLGAIQRKFELFRRLGFLRETVSDNVIDRIFMSLSQGQSVVLEFGRYGNSTPAYLFVANYLTRRIHERYVDAKNAAAGKQGEEPHPLMIVIEEAHKFLDPEIASHTIFGTIARELRKYNVTLLIVDQRPSGIDDEVMSQIGTRITALLDNEADIRAVFSGVSGASSLREVLARLDTKQQALIMGHAVPMPVVVRTREYGEAFYAEMGLVDGEAKAARARSDGDALFGDDDDDGGWG